MTEPEPIDVLDDNVEQASALLVGRTIVGFSMEPTPARPYTQQQNTVIVTLDDGTQVRFQGWGYDASGVDTTIYPPGSVGPS